jgi:hypothetical protein
MTAKALRAAIAMAYAAIILAAFSPRWVGVRPRRAE